MALEQNTATSDAPKAGRRQWIGLFVIMLPCMLYAMDFTVLNLAIPAIAADLRPSSAELLWIVDIYGFMVAGSLVTMGALGDRIGRRRVLLIGATAFGIASLLAAFSRSVPMLIGARALLGIAGATLAPSTLSLIRNVFLDPGERTVAIGIWVTSFSLGGAIGPLIGGALLQYYWWGSVFLIGVPVMPLLLVLAPILLPEFRDPDAGPLDLTSAGLSLAGVLFSIYGLKRIAEGGSALVATFSIMAGLCLVVAFVRRQRVLPRPFMDLGLFRAPAFGGSLAAYTLGSFVVAGAYVFVAQYLQLVLGLSPLRAGLATVPGMLGFIVASLVVPRIARRVHAAWLMGGGLVVVAMSLGVLTLVGGSSALAVIVCGSVMYSIGLTPVSILATEVIVGSAPVEQAGAASAISETSSEFGAALGIAVLGSIGVAVYRNAMLDGVPMSVPVEAAGTAKATLGGAVAVARHLPQHAGDALLVVAREAFVQAFTVTAAFSAALALTTAILALIFLRRPRVGPTSDAIVSPDASVSPQELP